MLNQYQHTFLLDFYQYKTYEKNFILQSHQKAFEPSNIQISSLTFLSWTFSYCLIYFVVKIINSMSAKYIYQAIRYSLVICRNHQRKYLVVQQKNKNGWWIPGGKLQPDQTFQQAAIRQCKEESAIDIVLKGIIRVDYGLYRTSNSLRVIYYAQPKFSEQLPLSQQNQHSCGASFKTLNEIVSLKWRSPQIFQFPNYLQKGGQIYPLSIFEENFNKM